MTKENKNEQTVEQQEATQLKETKPSPTSEPQPEPTPEPTPEQTPEPQNVFPNPITVGGLMSYLKEERGSGALTLLLVTDSNISYSTWVLILDQKSPLIEVEYSCGYPRFFDPETKKDVPQEAIAGVIHLDALKINHLLNRQDINTATRKQSVEDIYRGDTLLLRNLLDYLFDEDEMLNLEINRMHLKRGYVTSYGLPLKNKSTLAKLEEYSTTK